MSECDSTIDSPVLLAAGTGVEYSVGNVDLSFLNISRSSGPASCGLIVFIHAIADYFATIFKCITAEAAAHANGLLSSSFLQFRDAHLHLVKYTAPNESKLTERAAKFSQS